MTQEALKILYWDVDGVINATPSGKPKKPFPDGFSGWNDWEMTTVKGYPIMYSAEMISAINDLAARDDVECRWLTTWHQQAVDHLSPALGLNGEEWAVVGESLEVVWRINEGRGDWWKVTALLADRVKNPAAKAIWVDDYHDYYVKFPTRGILSKSGVTLVSTNGQAGLKKKQFADLLTLLG